MCMWSSVELKFNCSLRGEVNNVQGGWFCHSKLCSVPHWGVQVACCCLTGASRMGTGIGWRQACVSTPLSLLEAEITSLESVMEATCLFHWNNQDQAHCFVHCLTRNCVEKGKTSSYFVSGTSTDIKSMKSSHHTSFTNFTSQNLLASCGCESFVSSVMKPRVMGQTYWILVLAR